MSDQQDIAIRFYRESIKLNSIFLGIGTTLIFSGLLIIWIADGQVFKGFAVGLFIITPLLLLKALIDRKSYTSRLIKIYDSTQKDWYNAERQHIDIVLNDNEKHKKLCVYLMVGITVVGLIALNTDFAKPIWVSIIAIYLILCLEYINNLIEDFRISEYKYRLERDDA